MDSHEISYSRQLHLAPVPLKRSLTKAGGLTLTSSCFFFLFRDLKPENILLNDQMHIQITDFGSTRILEKEGLFLTEAPYGREKIVFPLTGPEK